MYIIAAWKSENHQQKTIIIVKSTMCYSAVLNLPYNYLCNSYAYLIIQKRALQLPQTT